MQDPSALYRLETDTDIAHLRAEYLLVALDGFLDAGHTQRLLVRHLLGTLEHSVVATFELDELLDYRGRRPVMTYDRDRWTSYVDPALVLYRMLDDDGVPFLLLSGPEPDYQWERTVLAIRQLIRRFGVKLTMNVQGVPMAVPHTRPVGMSVHATTDELRGTKEPVFGLVQVPGSLAALLELRLGEAGERAIGWAAHVPHYLAQADFPAASVGVLEAMTKLTGLKINDLALVMAMAENMKALEGEIAQTEDAAEVVGALEKQYDAFIAGRQRRALLSGDDSELPTADELGKEFERFLQAQPEPPDVPGSSGAPGASEPGDGPAGPDAGGRTDR